MALTGYFNNAGKWVDIATMPDAYLVNATIKYTKRLGKLKERPAKLRIFVAGYIKELELMTESLRAECRRRKLSSLLDN